MHHSNPDQYRAREHREKRPDGTQICSEYIRVRACVERDLSDARRAPLVPPRGFLKLVGVCGTVPVQDQYTTHSEMVQYSCGGGVVEWFRGRTKKRVCTDMGVKTQPRAPPSTTKGITMSQETYTCINTTANTHPPSIGSQQPHYP